MKYVKVSGIFVSTNATLTLSQAFTPSEWWPYFSLLVVSEEYTLDNIYGKNCVSGYIMYCFRAQTSQKMKTIIMFLLYTTIYDFTE